MPFLYLLTLTFNLDLQTGQSEGPYNVFLVNLAQICPALPEIFHIKQKAQTGGAVNTYNVCIAPLYETATQKG